MVCKVINSDDIVTNNMSLGHNTKERRIVDK